MNVPQVKSAQATIDLCWHLTVLFAVGICVNMLPDLALAAPTDSNAISIVFCNVVHELTGATGRAIATVAVIAVGVGALLGKISWGMALIVALGVAIIFGASAIVGQLGTGTPGAGSGCPPPA